MHRLDEHVATNSRLLCPMLSTEKIRRLRRSALIYINISGEGGEHGAGLDR